MRTRGGLVTRNAATLACGLLGMVLRSGYAASNPVIEIERQPVMVLLADHVLEHRLPDIMQIANGRFVSARDVQNACAAFSRPADGVLLYFPASKKCERISAQNQFSLRDRLQKLTGHWQMADPLVRARNEAFVAIVPDAASSTQTVASCGCSVDQAPDGASMCAAQTRTAGAAIGAVEFIATDVDSPALTGEFSYQRDSDPAEVGLPPEVSSSCVNGSGTLQCTLTGTAPAPAGILQFTLDVSDGTYTLPLETRLEVLAVGDRMFADNFEVAGCP